LLKSGLNLGPTLVKLVTSDKFTNILSYPLFIPIHFKESQNRIVYLFIYFSFLSNLLIAIYGFHHHIWIFISPQIPHQPKLKNSRQRLHFTNNNLKPRLTSTVHSSTSTQPTPKPSYLPCFISHIIEID